MTPETATRYFNKLSSANQQKLLAGKLATPGAIAAALDILIDILPNGFNREYANWVLEHDFPDHTPDILTAFDCLKGELPRELRSLEKQTPETVSNALLAAAEWLGVTALVNRQSRSWSEDPTFPRSPTAQLFHTLARVAEADPHNRASIPHLVRWLGKGSPEPILLEDLPGAREALCYWEKRKTDFPDLAVFPSLQSLRKALQMGTRTQAQREQYEQLALMDGNADLMGQGDNWAVIRINTMHGAQILGQGTSWCTSWGYKGDTKSNHFHYYNDNLTYFRIGGAAYQLYWRGNQLRDEDDALSSYSLLTTTPGLAAALVKSTHGYAADAELDVVDAAQRLLGNCLPNRPATSSRNYDTDIATSEQRICLALTLLADAAQQPTSPVQDKAQKALLEVIPQCLDRATHGKADELLRNITMIAAGDRAYFDTYAQGLSKACVRAQVGPHMNMFVRVAGLKRTEEEDQKVLPLLAHALPVVMEKFATAERSKYFFHTLECAEKHPVLMIELAKNPSIIPKALNNAAKNKANRVAAFIINFCTKHQSLRSHLKPEVIATLTQGPDKPLRRIRSRHLRESYRRLLLIQQSP